MFDISDAIDDALRLAEGTCTDYPDITPLGRRDLEWEMICCRACRTLDFSEMVVAIQRRRSHYHSSFILEAFLWFYSAPNRRWIERLPSLKSMARNPKLSPKNLGFIYRAVKQLVACHDPEQHSAVRLRELGDLLEQSHRLLTVDRELLLWLAAARLLTRLRAHTLAELALRQYGDLSIRLSQGQTKDVLGCAGDLVLLPAQTDTPILKCVT